jgi:hypothetical protein
MTWSPGDPRDGGEDDAVLALLLPRADGRSGPARHQPSAAAAARYLSAVDEALARRRAAGALEPTWVGPRPPVARAARPRPRPRPARTWLRRALVAAALLMASTVGVGAITLRLVDFRLGSAELAPAPEPAPWPAPHPAPAPPPPPPLPAPATEAPRPVFRPAPPPVRRAHRQRARDVADAQPAPGAAIPVPPDLPPEDLLSLASERRLRREWLAADAFYAAVVSRFPGTDAAVVAQVASASLHLRGLGDAAGAVAAYRRALAARPQGPLAEDARWGIAEALRALGDTRGEAEALREFLDRHPRSALAPAVRRRLEGLAP